MTFEDAIAKIDDQYALSDEDIVMLKLMWDYSQRSARKECAKLAESFESADSWEERNIESMIADRIRDTIK